MGTVTDFGFSWARADEMKTKADRKVSAGFMAEIVLSSS
jgi:hypothetical protein